MLPIKNVLVVAPHPDDETLGCGGTLLRHIAQGDAVHWLIMTAILADKGFSSQQIERRETEITQVGQRYGFASTHRIDLPTARLDALPLGDIVDQVSHVFKKVEPEVIYLPYGGDAHSDHEVTFSAVAACTKWFRYHSVKRVLVYETLSETDFGITPDSNGFRPNVFCDISNHLETKIEIMHLYASECGVFPFPRSPQAIRALAALRGAASGFLAAEAFMLLKEIL